MALERQVNANEDIMPKPFRPRPTPARNAISLRH